jgi:hypothetical protein
MVGSWLYAQTLDLAVEARPGTHTRLFLRTSSNEEKKFYNFQTWS